jgi:hypothetical protein
MLKAGRQKIDSAVLLPERQRAEKILEINEPVRLSTAQFLEGSLAEKAQGLFDLCRERGLL